MTALFYPPEPPGPVIATHHTGATTLLVLDDQQAVALPDGSTAVLHTVYQRGVPAITLRGVAAMPGTAGVLVLCDLERLAPGLDADLRRAPRRDGPGIVLYTLRARFATAAQLAEAALRHAITTWRADAPATTPLHRPLTADLRAAAC